MGFGRTLVPPMLVAAVAAAAMIACAGPTDADQESTASVSQAITENPPGDNGTVKIVEHGDIDKIPDNDPHVGCEFDIEFRGFDEGNLNATWTLYAQPPSGDFTQITSGTTFIGFDKAGGANDLDAVVPVNLAGLLGGLFEHPEQGFHLKLEVHADGAKGADTKYKVFWVTGCSAPPPCDTTWP